MNLFFNGVSSQGYIALFGDHREIIASKNFTIAGNESTKTTALIDEFLQSENCRYSDIRQIVSIIGPGSFTGIRTISLVVNTLAYVYPQIQLTGINFFDLYASYPIIKSSSKRDLFVKYESSATIEVVKNEDFLSEYTGEEIYGDTQIPEIQEKYTIYDDIDYPSVIQNITFENKKKLAPLYIKKPNIS